MQTATDTLFFKQYYLGCLSHASYLVGDKSTGRAVVVDPQRDVSQYIEDAKANDLHIERVIETHFHADFLSGHLELREATGAIISYGSRGKAIIEFPHEKLDHKQLLSLGDVVLEIRHTPGHTPESISIVISKHSGDEHPYAVLTGDTLFIGDVGRPDLLSSVGFGADELAKCLYNSLHNELLTLPDSTLVYPAHGAGSSCGKHLSNETASTIGDQRKTNYALSPMSESEFVKVVTQGQSVAPLYFLFAATRNRADHELLQESSSVNLLSLAEVLRMRDEGAVLIDAREPHEFALGHIKGSINVGFSGRFAEYVGAVVKPDTQLVLIANADVVDAARIRLARIGYDRVIGALVDMKSVSELAGAECQDITRLSVGQVAEKLSQESEVQLVDVRGPGETEHGVISTAKLIQLSALVGRLGELDPSKPTIVYCAGGFRSSIAASALRRHGFENVMDMIGGFDAWAREGQAITVLQGSH